MIAVVVVLGILAALAVPTFKGIKANSTSQVLARTSDAVMSSARANAAFNTDVNQGVVSSENLTEALKEAGILADALVDVTTDAYGWNAVASTLDFTKNGKKFRARFTVNSPTDPNGEYVISGPIA